MCSQPLVRFGAASLLLLIAMSVPPAAAWAEEAIVTVIADFENNSVAVGLGEVKNISPADCSLRTAAVPARGQQSLLVEIGATRADAALVCDLHVRMSTSFEKADRAAAYVYLQDAPAEVAIRLRDAENRFFETTPSAVRSTRRWERLTFALKPDALRPVGFEPSQTNAAPRWPIEVVGFHLATKNVGKQTIYIDDLEIEHAAPLEDVVLVDFAFDSPSHLYEPGALVKPTVWLENRSRTKTLRINAEIVWQRPNGTVIKTDTANVNLAAGAGTFRARNPIELNQRIDAPGLYRMLVRIRGDGWKAGRQFESTFAVLPSNAALARGGATFFGVRSNLLREPQSDRMLEIGVADTLGVQMLVIETPWTLIEPTAGVFRFAELDDIVREIARREMEPVIALSEPPTSLPAADAEERQERLLEALVRHFGRRVAIYQLAALANGSAPSGASREALLKSLREIQPSVELVAAPIPADSAAPLPATADGLRRAVTTSRGGDPRLAIRSLEKKHGAKLGRNDWWIHEASVQDSGSVDDLSDLIRIYCDAARAGFGAMIWGDLRDDSADNGDEPGASGLLRRDFSPRASLLGFASMAGVVSSLRCVGEAPGTPSEAESAVFLAPNRQVIVLTPRPNSLQPAVVQPTSEVPGVLGVLDFARRVVPPLDTFIGALVPLQGEPIFLETTFERIQDQRRVGFTTPWLRAPSMILCGGDASATIEITPPVDLTNSMLTLRPPSGAPYDLPFSTRRIDTAAGKTASIELRLTPLAGKPFERSSLTLRFSIEGEILEVPVVVCPLVEVAPAPADGSLAAANRIGELQTIEGSPRTSSLPLFAGHTASALQLELELPAAPAAGDVLHLDLAVEGEPAISLQIDARDGTVATQADNEPRPAAKPSTGGDTKPRLTVSIPRELVAAAFEHKKRLLLAARYRSAVQGDALWSLSESPESAGLRATGRRLILGASPK